MVGYSKGSLRVIENGDITEEHFDLTSPVTSTTFLPNGEYLYVSDALGTLVVYPANKTSLLQMKSIKHIVAKGGHRGPAAIQASRDSRLLAFVGPTEHCVTVLESSTLTCLVKLDVTAAVSSYLDSVQSVVFGTVITRDLFVCTMSGKVLRVDTRSGVIVSEHHPYPNSPPLLLVSDHLIVTASGRKFSVCDYKTLSPLQKYVAHDDINHAVFVPNLSSIVMCGDSITLWSFKGKEASLPVQDSKKVSFEQGDPEPVDIPTRKIPTPSSLEAVESDIRLLLVIKQFCHELSVRHLNIVVVKIISQCNRLLMLLLQAT